MESVGKRVIRTPGRYQEDVVPELSRPAFAHPIIPFNPDLPQPAFPTFDEPRAKELQLSKYYWVDGKDIRPPLPSRVMVDAQIDSDAAILAADQLAARPALVFRPTPRRVVQGNRTGPKTVYSPTTGRFTAVDNIGNFDDVSSLERQIEDAQRGHDFNVALEAFKEFPNWSDLSDGIKLVLFDEMMDKVGGSPEAAWKMLQLNDNEIQQLITMYDNETDRINDEKARIECFQEKSLELILAGERRTADDLYASDTPGGLLQGLQFSPTTIIKEIDTAAAKIFLRHIGIEDRKLYQRIRNHRGSQIIPTDELFKSSKTRCNAENGAADQDKIISSAEVGDAQNHLVAGGNRLGSSSNRAIVAQNAPPIIDGIAAHLRMTKKLKRKRKRLVVGNMPPYIEGNNNSRRLIEAQHHRPYQGVVGRGSGTDDFPLIRGPTGLREVMTFEEDEAGFSSRIDDSPAAVQPARSAIAPNHSLGRERLWPSTRSKVVRTYGKEALHPMKLIDNSWNPNPETNGDGTKPNPSTLPRSKITINMRKLAEKSTNEDASSIKSVDPNRPELSLTLFEERFHQHKTKNRSAWSKVTRLLNKEFSLAHTEADYRDKWPDVQRTVNKKLEAAKQLGEKPESANRMTHTVSTTDGHQKRAQTKETLQESRRITGRASTDSLPDPVRRKRGRPRRAAPSIKDESKERSNIYTRPAVNELTSGWLRAGNADVNVGLQRTAGSSRPRFDQQQLNNQMFGYSPSGRQQGLQSPFGLPAMGNFPSSQNQFGQPPFNNPQFTHSWIPRAGFLGPPQFEQLDNNQAYRERQANTDISHIYGSLYPQDAGIGVGREMRFPAGRLNDVGRPGDVNGGQFGGVIARFDTPIPRGSLSASGNRFSGGGSGFESGNPRNPLDVSANRFVSANTAFESGIPGSPFDASDNRIARGHGGFMPAISGTALATFDNRFSSTNGRLDSTHPRFKYPDPNGSQSTGPSGTGFC